MSSNFVQMELEKYDEIKRSQIDSKKIIFEEKKEDDGSIGIRLSQRTIYYIEDIIRSKFKEEYPNAKFKSINLYDWNNIGSIEQEEEDE